MKIKIMARVNGQNGWDERAWFPLTVVEAEDELSAEEIVGERLAADFAEIFTQQDGYDTGFDSERYGAYVNKGDSILYHIEVSGSVIREENEK